MVKNESIDNICVETSQPTSTDRGSFWPSLKKITFQHYQVRLEDLAGARAGRESGADIAVLLVELDLRVMGVYAVIFHSS